jgi:2-polyprenyl-3-methyl-5-hydroxy-6-metoxy-1,4-benzoquinol methylase
VQCFSIIQKEYVSPGIRLQVFSPENTRRSCHKIGGSEMNFQSATSGLLDPVTAYDILAPHYATISAQREQYLRSIEQIIAERIPAGSQSLLDVGAGDGARGLRIAAKAGIDTVVLLEPSRAMRRETSDGVEIWAMRAEDLNQADRTITGRKFDVIICLWNVLGHVPAFARGRVVQQLAQLLTPQGRMFLDVNHRYNARAYGAGLTLGRFLYDRLWPSERNGDVTVEWNLSGATCKTYGHVFTSAETEKLLQRAGLPIEEQITVDYATGRIRRFRFEGNLLYALRLCNSANESAKASQTSCTSASVS